MIRLYSVIASPLINGHVDSVENIWKINRFITSFIIHWEHKPKVLDKDPVQFHWWFISLEGSTRYLLPYSFPSADEWNSFAQTHSSEIQFQFFFCLCYGQKNISCCISIPVFFRSPPSFDVWYYSCCKNIQWRKIQNRKYHILTA